MARIAVIGAGHLGGTLGDTWRRAGHQVTFGVRDPEGRQEEGRRFVSPRDAVRGADVVLFAVPGPAMDAAVGALESDLAGKIVIDASNRVGAAKVRSGACEDIASEATPVFRAFNSLGWENFANPRYGDEVADLFYAGPDTAARQTVERLIADVGLRPMYMGPDADLVDGVLRLWFALAGGRRMGRNIAFKVLTR